MQGGARGEARGVLSPYVAAPRESANAADGPFSAACYVARFADAVYVLHAFKKKTAKTARADVALARQRSRDARAVAQGE